MEKRVLSFDIATKTGWAFITEEGKIKYGLIKVSHKDTRAKRLSYFRSEIKKLLLELKPTDVVMEDVFGGLNIKVLVLLAKLGGVVEECCVTTLGIEPYIIHTNTVKAYFKAKTKEELFEFVTDIIEWKNANFKKDNDIIDAAAQLLCYCDKVIKCKTFRFEKEYGYLYEV